MATKAAAATATAAKSTLSAAAEAGYQYTWKEKLQKFKAELAAKSTAAAVAAAKSAGAKSTASGVSEVSYQYPWMEKLQKFKGELRKGVWGYWHLGAWKPLALSARQRARLRKEVLLAGEDWPYDPPKGEMRTKRKGHKVDRIAAEKRANTAELMKKMPEMLLDYKKRRWEKKMRAEEAKD